jgi:hypothetical protein
VWTATARREAQAAARRTEVHKSRHVDTALGAGKAKAWRMRRTHLTGRLLQWDPGGDGLVGGNRPVVLICMPRRAPTSCLSQTAQSLLYPTTGFKLARQAGMPAGRVGVGGRDARAC